MTIMMEIKQNAHATNRNQSLYEINNTARQRLIKLVVHQHKSLSNLKVTLSLVNRIRDN